MSRARHRTGVCVARLEDQGGRVLISLLMTMNIDEPGERRVACGDVDEAVRHLRYFIMSFRGHPPDASAHDDP